MALTKTLPNWSIKWIQDNPSAVSSVEVIYHLHQALALISNGVLKNAVDSIGDIVYALTLSDFVFIRSDT